MGLKCFLWQICMILDRFREYWALLIFFRDFSYLYLTVSNHVVGLKAQRVRQIGTGLACALFAHSRKISIDDERFRYLGRLSISPAISISNLGMTVTFYIARYDFRYN